MRWWNRPLSRRSNTLTIIKVYVDDLRLLHSRGWHLSGLYLPSSDIDAVMLNTNAAPVQGLKAMAAALTRKNMAKNVQVRPSADMPSPEVHATQDGDETSYFCEAGFPVIGSVHSWGP